MNNYKILAGVAVALATTAASAFFVSCGRVEEASSVQDGAEASSNAVLKQPPCWRYQTVTAAIAALVIDCQGTIGPDSFKVVDDLLVPTFATCRDSTTQEGGSAPVRVDGKATFDALTTLLTVQKTPEDPNIRQCFAGRWNRWLELFPRAGLTSCPTWTKTEVIGDPSPRTLKQLAKLYPKVPVAPQACHALPDAAQRKACVSKSIQQQLQDPVVAHERQLVDLVPPPKTSQTYTVSSSDPQCDDPAVCAAQCAAAFPGFILAASGNRVDGDATYWLSSAPPFTFTGYTHPMCQYMGPPGAVYGHYNRIGETCWRCDEFDGLYVEVLVDARIPGVPLSHCGGF